MSGGNTLQTLLIGAAIIGTGGAAIGAAFPTLGGMAAVGGMGPTSLGFFGANASLFSTVASVASFGLSALGGIQGQQASKIEAQQLKEQAERDRLQTAIDKANRERKLADILSTQTAAFGARGIMLGSGVPQTANEISQGQANNENALDNINSMFTQRQFFTAVSQKKLEGNAALATGFIQGGRTLLSTATKGGFGV